MVTRTDIVAAARGWLGVPWRHQGRSRAGVDCVGLVVVVCRSLGLSDHDSTVCGSDSDPTRFVGPQYMSALNVYGPSGWGSGAPPVSRAAGVRRPVHRLTNMRPEHQHIKPMNGQPVSAANAIASLLQG